MALNDEPPIYYKTPADPFGPSSSLERKAWRLSNMKVRPPSYTQPSLEIASPEETGPTFPTGMTPSPSSQIGYEPAITEPEAVRLEPQSRGRDALSRALIGFQRGFAATPSGAAYDPLLGGIAGGLSGLGQSALENRQARYAAEAEANAPRLEYQKAALRAAGQEAAERPRREAERSQAYENTLALKKQGQDFLRSQAQSARDRASATNTLPANVKKDIEAEADAELLRTDGITEWDNRYAGTFPAAYNRALKKFQAQNVTGAGGGRPLPTSTAAPKQSTTKEDLWKSLKQP